MHVNASWHIALCRSASSWDTCNSCQSNFVAVSHRKATIEQQSKVCLCCFDSYAQHGIISSYASNHHRFHQNPSSRHARLAYRALSICFLRVFLKFLGYHDMLRCWVEDWSQSAVTCDCTNKQNISPYFNALSASIVLTIESIEIDPLNSRSMVALEPPKASASRAAIAALLLAAFSAPKGSNWQSAWSSWST